MTVLRGRSLNGRPQKVTLPTTGGITGGGGNSTPPALTGINFHQPLAINDAFNDSTVGGGGNYKLVVGTFDAIGGVGPFQYQVLDTSGTTDFSGYVALDTNYTIFANPATLGWIGEKQTAGKTATKLLKITDATGSTTTKTVTIDESLTTKSIWVSSQHWVISSNTSLANLMEMECALWTGSNWDLATPITVTDTGNYFVIGGGHNQTLFGKSYNQSDIPANGTYTVTLSAFGYSNVSFAYIVRSPVFGTPCFLQSVATVSTSMLAGTIIGSIACTTSNNNFTVSINDPTGVVGSSGYSVLLLQQPSSVGSISFTATITDNGASTTGTFSLSVVAGTTLPSSNMSFSGLTTTFNNDTFSNTLGTISKPAGVTGTPQWTIASQTGLNPVAVNSAFGTSPARYQIDPSTGALTAPAILSAGLPSYNTSSGAVTLPSATDTLVISCTDGINTCTSSLSTTINWAATTTYYIGRGMVSAHGAYGFEHIVDYRVFRGTSDVAPHAGTDLVLILADTDPDYYANDTGILTSNYAARFPVPGPVIMLGVANGGVSRPRMGGPAAGNVGGGGDMRGKGFLVFGHGDAALINVEGSGCHDAYSDGTHGLEFTRKDGETYGNWAVINCYIHDNQNGTLTGVCHGTALIEHNTIENSGTGYVSGGATHNAYIGEMGKCVFRYNVSRRSTNGYDLKCRAMVSDIHDNRFFDGLSGSGSALIDLPFAGQATIANNWFEKGPMALGPDTIRYGEEGTPYLTNTLTVTGNTAAVLTIAGGHYGQPSFVGWFGGTNSLGQSATATLSGNSLYLAAGSGSVVLYNGTSGSNVTETGTVSLALPAVLDTTRPDIAGSLPVAGNLYRHLSYGQDSFIHFDDAYQYQDRDQIQIASTTAAGATICTIYAANQLSDQGAGTANPFGSGTTWALVNDATPYGGFTGWATAKYTVTANSDGTAMLKVGGAITTGVDMLQVRAIAPNGTICDSRYAVVVTGTTSASNSSGAIYAAAL